MADPFVDLALRIGTQLLVVALLITFVWFMKERFAEVVKNGSSKKKKKH